MMAFAAFEATLLRMAGSGGEGVSVGFLRRDWAGTAADTAPLRPLEHFPVKPDRKMQQARAAPKNFGSRCSIHSRQLERKTH
jgi:hypothetical protein